MFDVPLDAWYVWVGLAAVSVALLATVSAYPTAPPPDAEGVADTVDAVALGEYPSTAEHGLAADRIRLAPTRVALAGDGGRSTETFVAERVTPVGDDDRLREVLDGQPPARAFDSPAAFAAAAEDARDAARGEASLEATGEEDWRAAPDRLRVRQVHWREVRVTLVG